MTKRSTVSVIGLGKLGSPLVAALASRGFKVFGLEIIPDIKKALRKHKAPFYEAQLQEFLTTYGDNIDIVDGLDKAVINSAITFIVVATPSQRNGSYSLEYVLKAIRDLGAVLKTKKDFHLVVLTSTVSPLSSCEELIPELEKVSGKKCGRDFGFCYSPEFIALGSVIQNLLYPDLVLIGESDKKAGDILEEFYHSFCPGSLRMIRTNIINAEIAKIALNSYVTMKISFANFLAELCEKTPGANVDAVTEVLGSDNRINSKYLKGGLGFGGPCFPRDNHAVSSFSRKMGVRADLARATDVVNDSQVKRVIQKINSLVPRGAKIGVLGLSYKPDTAVVEESQAVMIAEALSRTHKVSVYDPAAMENSKKILGKKVQYASSIDKCIRGAKMIILATPWKEFNRLFKGDGHRLFNDKTIIIDCWRTDTSIKLLGKKNYLPLGYFDKRVSLG